MPYLPEDKATSFNAISRLSPSTYANERLTHPRNIYLGGYMNMDVKMLAKMEIFSGLVWLHVLINDFVESSAGTFHS